MITDFTSKTCLLMIDIDVQIIVTLDNCHIIGVVY